MKNCIRIVDETVKTKNRCKEPIRKPYKRNRGNSVEEINYRQILQQHCFEWNAKDRFNSKHEPDQTSFDSVIEERSLDELWHSFLND